MDDSLLESKGIRPSRSYVGYVDGFTLRIGERATLVPDDDGRAYGMLKTITAEEAAALYSEPSVADYVAEPVVVTLTGNIQVPADCYNLPAEKLTGTNTGYAAALLALASSLGFPDEYLRQIRRQTK